MLAIPLPKEPQGDGVEPCPSCGNKLYHVKKGEGYLDFVCSVCQATFRVLLDEEPEPENYWKGCAC